MKKSELKDYIKEQITDILQEASKEDIQNQADLNKELEKTAQLKKDAGLSEDEDAKGVKHVVKYSSTNNTFQVWKGDKIVTDFATKEKAKAEAQRLNNLSSMQEVEDFEGETPTVDKTVQAKASKQDKIIKDFQRIEKQMKTHLEMFKDAEGEAAKNAAKNMLKKLTPEFQAAKKAYDKLKNVKV